MNLQLDSLQAYLFNRDSTERTLPAGFEANVPSTARADGEFLPVRFSWKHDAGQTPKTVFLAAPFNGWNSKKDALVFNK